LLCFPFRIGPCHFGTISSIDPIFKNKKFKSGQNGTASGPVLAGAAAPGMSEMEASDWIDGGKPIIWPGGTALAQGR
jgi:xylose isomerase